MNDVNAQKNESNTILTDTSETKILVSVPRRFYMGNGYDLLILSSADFTKFDRSKITTPRFTGVVNLGLNFHYDLAKRFGLFTGVGLKNLGLIDKIGNVTIKTRVYTMGIPLGIKAGNLRNRNFVFAGGGIDVPFNYREKSFTNRYKKMYKNSEWFSDATPRFMPYVFFGVSIDPGIIIKAQYYTGNFFNRDYEISNPAVASYKPFANYNAHIFALSFSIDIHYNQYKIQEREYRKWKAEQNVEKKS